MKTKINYIFSASLLLLGIIHTILTPMFFKNFNEDFLWFAGTGLAFVFLAFLNFSRIYATFLSIKIMCLIGNSFGLVFIICLMNTGVGVAPQAFVSLIVLFSLFLLSLFNLRQSNVAK